jgi:hypothetical protein
MPANLGRIDRAQCLFRPRPHCDILGQVHPLNRAIRINVKLSRPRNVGVLESGAAMKNIVTANDCGVGIGKERKAEAHLPKEPAIYFHRIDADGHYMNAARVEIRDTLLETPQLGVAKRSPMSAIKNQDRAIGRKQIRQCY